MYEFYNPPDSKTWKVAKRDLNNIYDEVPKTEGCLKYISLPVLDGGCGGRCCEIQQPSLFVSEFINTINWVYSHFKPLELVDINIRAIRTYVIGKPTNGCIFFNKENKMCTIHDVRPLTCRTYSQEPEEEFNPKYERLKVLYKDNSEAELMDQCSLTQTFGKKPTREQINNWWERLKLIEQDIGVDIKSLHDGDGGSYRTYVDHILLSSYSTEFLDQLTTIRKNGSKEEKASFLEVLEKQIKENYGKEEKEEKK